MNAYGRDYNKLNPAVNRAKREALEAGKCVAEVLLARGVDELSGQVFIASG